CELRQDVSIPPFFVTADFGQTQRFRTDEGAVRGVTPVRPRAVVLRGRFSCPFIRGAGEGAAAREQIMTRRGVIARRDEPGGQSVAGFPGNRNQILPLLPSVAFATQGDRPAPSAECPRYVITCGSASSRNR